jgi:hypothetical protein
MRKFPILALFAICGVILLFSGCRKEKLITACGNEAPYHYAIPQVLIENYVNRIYIDLIGREPLDVEMESEVAALQAADLSKQSRIDIIEKLQTDTAWIEGDTSYKHAYHNEIYDATKGRLIEGASNSYIRQQIGIAQNGYNFSVLVGDSAGAANALMRIDRLKNIIRIEKHYMHDSITINEVFRRLLDNSVYDFINMNTFNFVNASFDNLYFREPNNAEFAVGYDMVEYNISGIILGQSGSNKGDYMEILTHTREFYEGLIIWAFQSLLARRPTTDEVDEYMQDLYVTGDFQRVQRDIMLTNEYANF